MDSIWLKVLVCIPSRFMISRYNSFGPQFLFLGPDNVRSLPSFAKYKCSGLEFPGSHSLSQN